jgi:hypothetical protein
MIGLFECVHEIRAEPGRARPAARGVPQALERLIHEWALAMLDCPLEPE